MRKKDLAPKSQNIKSAFLSWGGLAASLLTIFLTGMNYYFTHKIDTSVQNLNEAKLEVDRLKFVSEILNDFSSKKKEEYTITINMVKLTLGETKSKELFEGLSISTDTTLRVLGTKGISSIELEEYQILIRGINAPDRNKRISSYSELVKKYNTYQPAINRTLAYFSREEIYFLNADGRVNALTFLLNTRDEAWNMELVRKAEDAIEFMKERDRSGIALIGDSTKKLISQLENKVNRIRNQSQSR